jgi:RNA ligase
MIHPAFNYTFSDLVSGLNQEIEKGNLNTRTSHSGLVQYTYTKQCVFDRGWNEINEMGRGLILDHENQKIVAAPFPKFFNFGEKVQTWPQGEFETFEKVDGSLIIVFFHNDEWHTATKGSFYSEQAIKAKELVASFSIYLSKGHTYLFEYVGPSNRIVIQYPKEELILLGVYYDTGEEYPSWRVAATAHLLRVRPVQAYKFDGFDQLHHRVNELTSDQEGFVIRFQNGLRLKMKGEEYCRIHRCISRVTPLAIWEAMQAGQNMEEFRALLPEEFWSDFDHICDLISEKYEARLNDIYDALAATKDFADRDLINAKLPKDIESMVRVMRKGEITNSDKAMKALYNYIRPKANHLEGYRPSSSLTRFEAET